MGLFNWLRGGDDLRVESRQRTKKRWGVGHHRVERTTRNRRVSPTGQASHMITEDAFRCVDCEKVYKSRDKFVGQRCYEVVRNGDGAPTRVTFVFFGPRGGE